MKRAIALSVILMLISACGFIHINKPTGEFIVKRIAYRVGAECMSRFPEQTKEISALGRLVLEGVTDPDKFVETFKANLLFLIKDDLLRSDAEALLDLVEVDAPEAPEALQKFLDGVVFMADIMDLHAFKQKLIETMAQNRIAFEREHWTEIEELERASDESAEYANTLTDAELDDIMDRAAARTDYRLRDIIETLRP